MSILQETSGTLSGNDLNIALSQIKLGFWELELNSYKLKCNDQYKINLGFDPGAELEYADVLAAILPEYQTLREETFAYALSPEYGIYFLQYRVRHNNRDIRWVESRGTVIFENRVPKRIVGTALDITEKKETELMREDIINITSHELKTPLAAVKGYLQLLHQFAGSTGENRYEDIAHRALSATEKMARLLDDSVVKGSLRNRQLILKREPLDMVLLAREVAENIMLIHPDYLVTVLSEEMLISVLADRFRISQVFTNLINNAVKYSPVYKKIDVSLQVLENQLIVRIRDFGIGLAQEEHDLIFQKYYRVNGLPDEIQGSGIGLFLCSEIVLRHGGRIGVEPPVGKTGTCFYFTLPL